jgi:hypothetical protein
VTLGRGFFSLAGFRVPAASGTLQRESEGRNGGEWWWVGCIYSRRENYLFG